MTNELCKYEGGQCCVIVLPLVQIEATANIFHAHNSLSTSKAGLCNSTQAAIVRGLSESAATNTMAGLNPVFVAFLCSLRTKLSSSNQKVLFIFVRKRTKNGDSTPGLGGQIAHVEANAE